MLWIWIVLISLFANAAAQLLDKFLLSESFPNPIVLTFWTAVWNGLGIVFIFFNFNFFPGWYLLIIALLSGTTLTIALQFLYMGLKTGEASHIAPLVGGVVPVFTFIISYLWLGERLNFYQQVAVLLLVLGALLISFEKSKKHSGIHIGMLWAVISGLLFAVSYVMARAVYLEETFATGFVWARIGAVAAALPILLIPRFRKLIFAKSKKSKEKNRKAFTILAINKTLASVSFVGMNFAVSLASATLVNALAGLQYAVLFILIYICTKKFPKFFKEQFTRGEIVQQIMAIVLIVVGLGFIVLS
jgi:drug/metabolite transporter (DMT)-like permease